MTAIVMIQPRVLISSMSSSPSGLGAVRGQNFRVAARMPARGGRRRFEVRTAQPRGSSARGRSIRCGRDGPRERVRPRTPVRREKGAARGQPPRAVRASGPGRRGRAGTGSRPGPGRVPGRVTSTPARSRFLCASDPRTSSTTRCAALTVLSAWSYGGATSTTSKATSGVSSAIDRTARSRSAGFIPPGLRSPGTRCETRIEHIDVDGEVDRVAAVTGPCDGVLDDGTHAAVPHLVHEMPGHVLFLHPVEHVGRRPVAAQPALDEIAAAHRARLDQPAHRRAVRDEIALDLVSGVRVRVEVQQPELAPAELAGDGGGRRVGDRVVTADDDGEGAGVRARR